MTPLVLLHGFLGCASDWDSVRADLDPHFDCVPLDLPGHGADPLDVEATNFEEGVDQVRRLIEGLGIQRCQLIGYSMGGRIAMGLLCRAPSLVSSVIAVGASAGISDPADRARRWEDDQALADELEQGDLGSFIDRWYQQELFGPLRRNSAYPAVRARRLRASPSGLAASLRAFGVGSQPSLEDQLSRSTARILLLAGALDAKYVSLNGRLSARCPSIQNRAVPGCGHSPHLEAPRELARIVFDSIAQHQE